MDRFAGDLEIKVISAKHLWAFNFFQKLCVYATASLSAKDQMQEQRTAADPTGDSHPEWNHPMTFHLSDLPSPADHFLRFDLRHHAGLPFPDRTIGEVRVPLSDLLEPSDGFRFVDYQIRSSDDKPNGVLHFGYKLKQIGAHSPVSISGYPQISDQIEKPPTLYPTADQWEDTPAPADEPRPAVYPPAYSAARDQYPTPPPPMWHPPPPYWPPPPGFMHPPPPPPPPGHLYYPWNHRQQTEGQNNNGR